jgi:hypothetical protein
MLPKQLAGLAIISAGHNGIHVVEGKIDLAWTLADLRIDDKEPALTSEEKQTTIADLLGGCSSHQSR